MSQDNAKKFMDLIRNDVELQKKVTAAMDVFTGDSKDEKAVFEAIIAPIAKEAGYDFSFEDMT